MSDRTYELVAGLFVWVVLVVLLFPFAILFMVAWNHVAPAFALPHLDYWQAFALLYVIHQIFPSRVLAVHQR